MTESELVREEKKEFKHREKHPLSEIGHELLEDRHKRKHPLGEEWDKFHKR